MSRDPLVHVTEAGGDGPAGTGSFPSGERLPSVCLVCVASGAEERRWLERECGRFASLGALPGLRVEVLLVGEGTPEGEEPFGGLPVTVLSLRNPQGASAALRVRSCLAQRGVDLVLILSRRRLFLLRLALSGLPIVTAESLPAMKGGADGAPSPLLPADEENPGGILSSAGFYRTLLRERDFSRGRKALSLIRTGVGKALSRETPPPGTLRILMYHRIADTLEKDILAVTPFAFARQMAWLKSEGWQVLPLREALLRLEQGALPDRAAALTFDDGYRDNYEEAFPVLARLGFPATVFPVTGFVLEESEHRRYRGRSPGIPYLTVSQIREMKAHGMEFGGHTHTHPLLPGISCEAAQEEILRAKKLLEEWTGEKSTLFAYPNGAYSRDHFRILDGLGYEAALSVRPGAHRKGTLRWILRRTEISGRDSFGDFIQKMNGGLDLWHGLYQSVRGFYR